MRSWKMFASALALGLAATAWAQPGRDAPPGAPPGPPPGGPGGMERILQELRLTEKQQEQVRGVLTAHHDKMRKLAEQARADLLKQLKGVLSAEQFNKIKEQLERMPPGPPQPPPGGRRPEGREAPGDRPARPGPREPREGDERRGGPGGPREGDERRGPPGGAEGRRGLGGPGGMERILAELNLTDKQKEKVREVLKAQHEELLKKMKDVLSEDQYKKFKEQLESRRPTGPPRGPREGDGGRRARPENP